MIVSERERRSTGKQRICSAHWLTPNDGDADFISVGKVCAHIDVGRNDTFFVEFRGLCWLWREREREKRSKFSWWRSIAQTDVNHWESEKIKPKKFHRQSIQCSIYYRSRCIFRHSLFPFQWRRSSSRWSNPWKRSCDRHLCTMLFSNNVPWHCQCY